MKDISEIVAEIKPPGSVEIANEAMERQERGEDVINLGWGEPEFQTPRPVRESLFNAINEGHTGYTDSAGIRPLRERIVRKFDEENDVDISPDGIIATPGAKQAIFITLRTLLNPSDEVIVPEPGWTSYAKIISLAGARPRSVSGVADDRFVPDASDVEDAVTDDTKAIIVNSPTNPTGAVWTADELASIATVAEQHDLYIVSDEIYEKYTFEGHDHTSIASLPAAKNRTITINGFSKSHAMTGWRLGYLGTSDELQSEILTVQQHVNTCAPSFVQHAGVTALETTSHIPEAVDRYQRNRDVLVERTSFDVVDVQGAFYALLDLRSVNDDIEVAATILEETGIAVTPGQTYGSTGRGYVRVSLAKSTETICEAVSRLEDWYTSV